MKTRKTTTMSSQILILILAGLVLSLMVQFAQASDNNLTSNNNLVANAGNNNINQTSNQTQILQVQMPQKSLKRKLMEDTSFSYYYQLLGPTVAGGFNETYNVFQEGAAPIQSFQAMNLRHQIDSNWSVGASLAFSDGYGKDVVTKEGYVNSAATEFYNARAYVGIHPIRTRFVNIYPTLMYEAPTSSLSRQQNMKYGGVAAANFAANLPSYKWSTGLLTQYYRTYYNNNVQQKPGYDPVNIQTTIFNVSPYLSYRFNDAWMLGGLATFDWDQRGNQTGSSKWNNNLPDRFRITGTYFPRIKYLASVGLFTQALMNYTKETTVLGGEFTLRF